MMLRDLLTTLGLPALEERYGQYTVAMISCDSREAQKDGLFVALPGFKFDGNDFIKDAVAQGARIIAKKGPERRLSEFTIPDDIAVLDVKDPKSFLRVATLHFYGQPSQHIRTIGITGTNGKTTITYLLESIIHAAGQSCGVIGTVNYRIGNKILPSKNTTPGFLDNQRLLAELLRLNVGYCVMETSSHALAQGRVDGIDFAGAVFTNLTQDHLDFHKDMESYFQAKALLFTHLTNGAAAVINSDDSYGKRLVPLSKGRVITYAIDQQADVHAQHIHYQLSGTDFDIVYPSGKVSLHTRLIGKHNVYNLLAAFALAYALGFDASVIKKGLEGSPHVPGRLEAVNSGQDFFVFIDYAHTEDGLINVLKSLRAVSPERIIVVFGCGGDRDKGKRPKMGAAACTLADYSIVTSDNPRSEDPQSIIDEILTGFTNGNYETCVDRREAIGRALKMAQKGQLVLIAGKGHESEQIFKDKTIPFNERKIVEDFLKHVHH